MDREPYDLGSYRNRKFLHSILAPVSPTLSAQKPFEPFFSIEINI
jgi:hypothetical protein